MKNINMYPNLKGLFDKTVLEAREIEPLKHKIVNKYDQIIKNNNEDYDQLKFLRKPSTPFTEEIDLNPIYLQEMQKKNESKILENLENEDFESVNQILNNP